MFYAGLPEHPGHELAARQQNGFGGIVSIELEGGRNEAWKFIDGTKLFSITANLGDTKSTITHPATTTHSRLTDAEREQSGISQSLIRLSIGHEHVDDVKADLEHALHNSLK